MTDEQAVAMHRALAAYHAELAKRSILDIVHEHHADLAERLAQEADHIPERAAARARVEARHAQQELDEQ